MTFSIFPRMVYKTKSKISGEIVVKEQLGQYTLHVQGMIQSGGVVKGVWKKALKRVVKVSKVPQVPRVLILGLGGGTVVPLIKAQWPEAKIVGIEIDPEIVKIGREFFGLSEIKNLEVVTVDAIEWVRSCLNDSNHFNKEFDLIIVDLYLGDQFPPQVESGEFLKNIRSLLSKKGMVIFNRLKNKSEKKLERKLRKFFSQIKILETPTNLLFLVSK